MLSDIYFVLLQLAFDSYNGKILFWSKKTVRWPSRDHQLLCLSARMAAKKIRLGEISSVGLMRAYINRAREVDILINAIVTENFDLALEEAENVDTYLNTLDIDYRQHMLAEEKPLLGVPFTCKDNLYVKGLLCVAGSKKMMAHSDVSTDDATVVRRLREAGAIFLATTNMAESMETENEVFGLTRNPYNTLKSVGGSSGGEGALISSAGSLIGIGNDLGGSIRVPATFCGIYGLKTTSGLLPLDGLVASLKDDYRWTIGPMCRYAEDLSLVLSALADKSTRLKLETPLVDIEGNIKSDANIRVYYMFELRTFLSQTPTKEMRQAVENTIKFFESCYEGVPQLVDFPLMHNVFELWAAARYKPGLPLPTLRKILVDFARLFLHRIGSEEASYFELGLDFLGIFLAPQSEDERNILLGRIERLRYQLTKLLDKNGVLVFPAFPNSAPWHNQPKFSVFNLAYTTLFNFLGLPSLACPTGMGPEGMPVGVQLVGAPHSEYLLCALAKQLESELGGWTPLRTKK